MKFLKFLPLGLAIFLAHSPSAKTKELEEREKEILKKGPIDQTTYIASGILGTFPGFGIGHAIQGRWKEKGWIFTAGESIGVGLMGIDNDWNGDHDHNDDDHHSDGSGHDFWNSTGAVVFLTFKVWETIDVWAAPPKIDRRYEQVLRKKNEQANFQIFPFFNKERGGVSLIGRF